MWYAPVVKPLSRTRSTVKCTAAASALLLLIWLGSAWWDIRWVPSGGGLVRSREGRVEVLWPEPRLVFKGDAVTISGTRVTLLNPEPAGFKWWVFVGKDSLGWSVCVPLWIPGAMMLLLTAGAWRLDTLARRRALLNLCPACHYDRTGLPPHAPCPECAAPDPSLRPARPEAGA